MKSTDKINDARIGTTNEINTFFFFFAKHKKYYRIQ